MPYIPLLSSTFPSTTPGPYKRVGYAFMRCPVAEPFSLTYPKLPAGGPALLLSESAFAVYYPVSHKGRGMGSSTVGWLPDPVQETVHGYEKFLGRERGSGLLFSAIRSIAGRFKMPLIRNAPLASQTDKFPLVIFSHGLAGTRNTYSQFCTALASEGYVVLAVEHHDGSGPSVTVTESDGSKRTLPYTAFAETKWEDDSPELMDLRGLQLDFRLREVYEAYSAFTAVLDGKRDPEIEDLSATNTPSLLDSFRGHVDPSNLVLAGHSFGAGTVLRLMQTEPPAQYPPLKAVHAIALDPWLEPFRTAAELSPSKLSPPPTLVINSQGFTQWKEHFPDLITMCKNIDASLMTVVGLGHQGFSDFPLLTSRSTSTVLGYHATINTLSKAFLDNKLASARPLHLERCNWSQPDAGNFAKDAKHHLAGQQGDVVVHFTGVAGGKSLTSAANSGSGLGIKGVPDSIRERLSGSAATSVASESPTVAASLRSEEASKTNALLVELEPSAPGKGVAA